MNLKPLFQRSPVSKATARDIQDVKAYTLNGDPRCDEPASTGGGASQRVVRSIKSSIFRDLVESPIPQRRRPDVEQHGSTIFSCSSQFVDPESIRGSRSATNNTADVSINSLDSQGLRRRMLMRRNARMHTIKPEDAQKGIDPKESASEYHTSRTSDSKTDNARLTVYAPVVVGYSNEHAAQGEEGGEKSMWVPSSEMNPAQVIYDEPESADSLDGSPWEIDEDFIALDSPESMYLQLE